MNEQQLTAPGIQAPEDPIEALRRALEELGGEPAVLEVWRVESVGRGAGPQEWLEDFPFDYGSVNEGLSVMRARLRDKHRGGQFKLVVRDDGGGYRINKTIRVERQPEAVQQAPAVQPLAGLAELFARMDANAQAAAERVERILAAMVEKKTGADDFDTQLERMTKMQALFGQGKKDDLFDAIEKVEKLKEVFGAGEDGGWPALAREVAPEIFGLIRDLRDGGDADGDDEEEEPDDAESERREAIKKALGGFTAHMVKAARMKVAPDVAAGFALRAVKKPEGLVKFCQKENATGLLCEVAPELVPFAGWVERVRGEIVKAGSRRLTAPPVEKPAGASNANDAGLDTERAGGRAGDAAKNAGHRRAVKATANGTAAGGESGAAGAGKKLRGRGRAAAQTGT